MHGGGRKSVLMCQCGDCGGGGSGGGPKYVVSKMKMLRKRKKNIPMAKRHQP